MNCAVLRAADLREDGYSDGRAGEGAELLGIPLRLLLNVIIRKRPFLLFFLGEVLHVYHLPYCWTV